MFDIFQYSFMVRGLQAGILIAVIAPLIGIFLVLKRYSLIADTLSHVSLAGVAFGLLLKINPLITAVIAALISSVAIDKLRVSKKISGESALAVFLSGSLAVAIIIINLSNGFSVDIFNYLFGSILTVKSSDIVMILGIGALVLICIFLFYKELFAVTFDEEYAKVSGIPTKFINLLLISLASLTIAISIPVLGALLISALIVIPVITALQFKASFKKTILIAEALSILSVVTGIIASFYLEISSGGTIVLINIFFFVLALIYKHTD
jgi:zinc transport system permease protein